MSRKDRQPMPVINAMMQPGCYVYLPPSRPGEQHRRQKGQLFVQQTLVDEDVRRVWVGAVPDVKGLLPESLVRKARNADSWRPETEHSMGQEVINSLGPQRIPFPQLWIEFAVPQAESESLAPVAAYVMETDYGYGICFFRLMPDGQVYATMLVEQISVNDEGIVTGMQCEWALDDRASMDDPAEEDEFAMVHLSLPVMWAIGLMNCRNVHTVEVRPEPRRTKKQRRPRRAGVSYHTIVLPSVRYSATAAVNPERGSLSDQPLHMVRGHTKTYTAEAPLLGKHVGTYWWGYQVRGSKENGEIISDYQMAP